MSGDGQTLEGVIERIVFHAPDSGWTVARLNPIDNTPPCTVCVHHARLLSGGTFRFQGRWVQHRKYGRQFHANWALESKPASAAALEKFLGSGLISGIGPTTAKRIVAHFGEDTLDVFDGEIERLKEVRGIAEAKLATITQAWEEHRAVRDVMMFLQSHGVSTQFAAKIYRTYGQQAIRVVQDNPYRLAEDIFGVGFFSADRIALSLGFDRQGVERASAAVMHVFSASRDNGHCYMTRRQIEERVIELFADDSDASAAPDPHPALEAALKRLHESGRIYLDKAEGLPAAEHRFYPKALYEDEQNVAQQVRELCAQTVEDEHDLHRRWLDSYGARTGLTLSDEQARAVLGIAGCGFAVLTGGPGCGKTTSTQALVQLHAAMHRRVVLAAPTGRAAQRMQDVIGLPAKTIHRLLEWEPHQGGFKRGPDLPLALDVLVVDECSMLDISLTAALLSAVPAGAQVVFIGDPHQLPSVGPGNVLQDLIASTQVPCFTLTQVFRQAESSSIVRFAHEIHHGRAPSIPSPYQEHPDWSMGTDCLFFQAEEANQEQAHFIQQTRRALKELTPGERLRLKTAQGETLGYLKRTGSSIEQVPPSGAATAQRSLLVSEKFAQTRWVELFQATTQAEALRSILKRIPDESALHRNAVARDLIRAMFTQPLPRPELRDAEIQVLTPMHRGSLGAFHLNAMLQDTVNPRAEERGELKMGDLRLRPGDRVLQKRNNYDHNVFNGDIGMVREVDPSNQSCVVDFERRDETQTVVYQSDDLLELSLAYAMTIHKSQGSEFDVVIIPIAMQHFRMLYRNLIYTALTRAKQMAIFIGTRRALALAVHNLDSHQRQTTLAEILATQAKASPKSL